MASMELRELIRSGKLKVGTELYHLRRGATRSAVAATVVREGLRVGSQVYTSPSSAARAVTGRPVAGWSYWRLPDGRVLGTIRPSS